MYDIKINKRIKQIRKEHNVSQQEFGEKLGVSRDVISNIENNRVEVKTVFITHMCEIFNVNKEWLTNGTGAMYIENKCNRNISEATDLLMELSIEFQECAINQIKELIKLQQSLKSRWD